MRLGRRRGVGIGGERTSRPDTPAAIASATSVSSRAWSMPKGLPRTTVRTVPPGCSASARRDSRRARRWRRLLGAAGQQQPASSGASRRRPAAGTGRRRGGSGLIGTVVLRLLRVLGLLAPLSGSRGRVMLCQWRADSSRRSRSIQLAIWRSACAALPGRVPGLTSTRTGTSSQSSWSSSTERPMSSVRGGGVGVEAHERLRLALGVALEQVALARPRRRRLEDAAHQAALELLGLVVEDLAGLAQRGEIARLQAAVDAIAQHGILAERRDHERAQLLQEVAQSAPFPNVAFTIHGRSAVPPGPELTGC